MVFQNNRHVKVGTREKQVAKKKMSLCVYLKYNILKHERLD